MKRPLRITLDIHKTKEKGRETIATVGEWQPTTIKGDGKRECFMLANRFRFTSVFIKKETNGSPELSARY